jgi:DNA-directed RNA polymerase II subunit RPB1
MSISGHKKFINVSAVKFGIMSPEEMVSQSVVEVEFQETFDPTTNKPKMGGLMDPRLGPTNPYLKCQTCGEKMDKCTGHFGHIILAKPVYHPSFIDIVLKILRNMCHTCGRLLIYPGDLPISCDLHSISQIIKTKRKKYSLCGSDIKVKDYKDDEEFLEWHEEGCGARQYKYKKENMKIIREREGEDGEIETNQVTAESALTTLRKVSDEDLKRCGFKSLARCRPEWMILTMFPVPPPTVRPSLLMDGKRGEDDLTFKLSDIVKANNNIKKHEQKNGEAPHKVVPLIELLQFHVATYINNDYPNWGISQQRSHRPIKGVLQRFHTKTGRLRGNLMGKRGDYTARTVIGGDPRVSIRDLVVPEAIAKVLTYPESVTDYNKDWLKSLIQNGPNEYPGATHILKSTGEKIDLRFCGNMSLELENNDVVERHLKDDDTVIFNRQPSLHRMSIMGHNVKVMPNNTFRFSLAVTTPYNADYDGKLVAINSRLPCWFFESPMRVKLCKFEDTFSEKVSQKDMRLNFCNAFREIVLYNLLVNFI